MDTSDENDSDEIYQKSKNSQEIVTDDIKSLNWENLVQR